MPIVTVTLTFTLSDNPAAHTVEKTFTQRSSFTPAVGGRISPAQAEAMDLMLSTSKQFVKYIKPDARDVQVANYGSVGAAA